MLAGVLASGFAVLAIAPVVGMVWLRVRLGAPAEALGLLGMVAVPMSLGLGWVALLGFRDVLVGFELRFHGGRLSWPLYLWRTSVPLDQLADVALDGRSGDVVVVLADGRRVQLAGTGFLAEADRLIALEAIRVMLPAREPDAP